MKQTVLPLIALASGALLAAAAAPGRSAEQDAAEGAALDTQYQAAVERNAAAAMDRILADDFVLVLGNGTVHTKAELLDEARTRGITWEQQKEIDASQKVRVWGDTAVVTTKHRGARRPGFRRRSGFGRNGASPWRRYAPS